MNENQKFILAFSLFVIAYTLFFVTSNPTRNVDLPNMYRSQAAPNESSIDFNISPQPLLPPDTPFEHNQHCSCDQDVLVHNDTLNTCNCQTGTRKTCICDTCTCSTNPRNSFYKNHELQ